MLRFGVGYLGQTLDRVESLVPLRGQIGHGPGGLVETVGIHLVENFSTLLSAAHQSHPFQHDQMSGNRLPGEWHLAGQPPCAGLTIDDDQVEHPATRRIGDDRPQLIIGPCSQLDCSAATSARRPRKSPHPFRCSSA